MLVRVVVELLGLPGLLVLLVPSLQRHLLLLLLQVLCCLHLCLLLLLLLLLLLCFLPWS